MCSISIQNTRGQEQYKGSSEIGMVSMVDHEQITVVMMGTSSWEKLPDGSWREAMQGTKIFKYCACPAGRVTLQFHSSCKHMCLSFKNVCSKEQKEVI